MTSVNTRLKEFKQVAAECGLTLLSHSISGGTHYKLVVQRSDGATCSITASFSPSDRRAFLNNRAIMRRFAKDSTHGVDHKNH